MAGQAFAYLRTSSAANVAEAKDSAKRQRKAIETYAKRSRLALVAEFNDAAVSGADPIDSRPGFAAMLEALAANGTKTIIVETANRFARDLMVQEVGYAMLKKLGIELIAADSPSAFIDDTPTARLIRQVLGAVSEFEKAMLVAKLRGARERKRREGKKVEGRKALAETERGRKAIEAARKLWRLKGKAALSFREIAAELAQAGHVTRADTPYSATAVKRMVKPASTR